MVKKHMLHSFIKTIQGVSSKSELDLPLSVLPIKYGSLRIVQQQPLVLPILI